MQIVVDEGGGCEFTRKPHLLNLLHENDRKRIERMTDIKFDEDVQKYYITFLRGPMTSYMLGVGYSLLRTEEFIEEYCGGYIDGATIGAQNRVLYFDTYEQAVDCEVKYVEFLRDLGYSMV
jgi:hypothetical protein